MPPPPHEYVENEAAIYWGYTLKEWQQETAVNRAQCKAHYLHHCLREGYAAEKMFPNDKSTKSGGAKLESMLNGLGIPGF